mgnify:CR=1 FL=1
MSLSKISSLSKKNLGKKISVSGWVENIRDHVQVFIVGSSYSSNYALGILEQIKDKKIEIFYLKT